MCYFSVDKEVVLSSKKRRQLLLLMICTVLCYKNVMMISPILQSALLGNIIFMIFVSNIFTADEFSRETMVKQRSEFLQWGLMADWSNPYITSDKEFVQHELSVFQQMYDKVSSKQVQVSSFGT